MWTVWAIDNPTRHSFSPATSSICTGEIRVDTETSWQEERHSPKEVCCKRGSTSSTLPSPPHIPEVVGAGNWAGSCFRAGTPPPPVQLTAWRFHLQEPESQETSHSLSTPISFSLSSSWQARGTGHLGNETVEPRLTTRDWLLNTPDCRMSKNQWSLYLW